MSLYNILLLLAFFFVGWGCSLWFRRSSAPQFFGRAVWHVETPDNVMALTFDDGPNPPYTEHILDLLSEYHAKATFFMVGQQAERCPDTVKKVIAEGHDIGNHSWNHSKLIFKKPSFIKDQIVSTDKIIREMGYDGTIYFRAPFGRKLIMLPYLLKKMGRLHVLWNVDLKDWKNYSPEDMFARFKTVFTNGSIVLLHDLPNTRQLVKYILETYQKKGYRFVTISELLQCETN